jgi:hypothetical protein
MSINYNNIEELLDIIEKFVYNPDNEILENFMYKRLDPSNITFNEIIKNNDFEYHYILNTSSKDKPTIEIIDTIKDVSNNIKVITKKYLKNKPVMMIIQKNENKYYGTTSIIDIYYELFMNQIISEFIIYDKIPFYLINICNFNINYERLVAIEDYREIIIKEYKLIDLRDTNINFCISLYGYYNEYTTLKEILNNELSNIEIANILFQVLFSHAYLNYKLGNFRHNNFTIESIIIEKMEKSQNYNLNLGDMKFKIDDCKYVCKLFNFRNSVFDKYTNIYKCIIDNPSYDIYLFLKSMYDYAKKINKNFDKIKIIISNFITTEILEDKILSESIFINKYPYSIVPFQILTKNNFFSNFINMNNLKHLESDKKLIGGVIQSITENSDDMNTKNSMYEFGKKNKSSKKTVKKTSKKNSKKSSKKNLKKNKLSRQLMNLNENMEPREPRETRETRDRDTNNERKKNRDEVQEEVYEEVEEIDNITPDEENQNDDLMTDGDDDRQKVPTDDTEKGRKKTKNSYKTKSAKKSSKKSSKKASKKSSKKASKKSSKKASKKSITKLKREIMNLEQAIKDKEEKLRQKENKKNNNDSTTLTFNFSDSSSVKNNSLNNKYSSVQKEMPKMQPNTQEQKPNIMLPSNETQVAIKQKNGTNNDMNALLEQLNEDQLIPVIPEMQQMFDINQLELQQEQAYQRGQASVENYTGQPQIMDQSIINMARSGKLPMPFLNGVAPMNNSLPMNNAFSMNNAMQMPINNSLPSIEMGLNNNKEETNNLVGGNKNFFLKKKK